MQLTTVPKLESKKIIPPTMSCYTLEHIIDECISEKGTRFGISKELYFEVWNSVNKWIDNRMAKRKGANIPLFGTLAWESVGDNTSRPVFIMNDAFVKLHRVKKPRKFSEPSLSPVDELNYSQIAIKYSTSLTKDMVFVGVRDIVKKIGDFVDRMYEFDIGFSVGTLRCKDRRVKFEFNLARLTQVPSEVAPFGFLLIFIDSVVL